MTIMKKEALETVESCAILAVANELVMLGTVKLYLIPLLKVKAVME